MYLLLHIEPQKKYIEINLYLVFKTAMGKGLLMILIRKVVRVNHEKISL